MTTYQQRLTERAVQLYDLIHFCHCGHPFTLADGLRGACPRCHRLGLAGPIHPDRARQMLRELETRRREMGLEVRG